MPTHIKIWMIAAVLLFSILIPACRASSSDVTPTMDANTVRTSAAITAQARLTEMGPRTAEPTTTPYVTATNTLQPTATQPGLSTNTPAPLVTATNPTSPDVGEWVSQSPADNTAFAPGAAFKMTWTIKNVGKSTWTRAYQLRFYANSQLGGPSAINFNKDVPPGETIDLTIDMTAPSTPGDYHSIWVLTSDKTGNFYPIDIRIKVGSAPAATQTHTPTPPAAAATVTATLEE
jgi:hypothetical protein